MNIDNLKGRIFSYADTHRHRLGTNYLQIPVNCPFRVSNYQRDGPQTVNDNQVGAPNYYPNSFKGPEQDKKYVEQPINLGENAVANRYDTSAEDNFSQAGDFWRNVLGEPERARLVANIAGHIKNAAEFIQNRAIDNFGRVDPDFGRRLRTALNQLKN